MTHGSRHPAAHAEPLEGSGDAIRRARRLRRMLVHVAAAQARGLSEAERARQQESDEADRPIGSASRLARVCGRPARGVVRHCAAGVWSVVCFFVAKHFRRRGLTTKLLDAAAAYARKHGARIIEGYPVDPKPGTRSVDVFVWTGLASAFRNAGFEEVQRRSPTRPIMRRVL